VIIIPPLNPKQLPRLMVRKDLIPKGGFTTSIKLQQQMNYATSIGNFQQTQYQLSQQSDPSKIDPSTKYAHTQPWRLVRHGGLFAHLGAMGTHESQVIIALEIQNEVFTLYDQIFRSDTRKPLRETELLAMIKKSVYDPLQIQLRAYMERIVPFDTGRLLNAMELALAGGRGGGQSSATSQLNSLRPFYVVLNTGGVEYANVVSNMGVGNVRHPHAGSTNKSYRTGRIVKQSPHNLHDPHAKPTYFEDSVEFGQRLAENLWHKFKYNELITFLSPIIKAYRGVHPPVTNKDIVDSLFEVEFK
jgi:hypothetical protein